MRPPGPVEDVTRPVLHACTRPLPADRGDFGSGVVDLLGPDDVFVALVDYGSEVADVGLFANQGMPRLAPSQFGPNRLQRPLPGLSASQHFFSEGGRAFCLFTVLGSHARRMATVQRAVALVRTVRITDRDTLARQGGTAVSTLDDLTTERGPGGLVGFVSSLSERLRPVKRRDVLVGATVAAAALATKPKDYVLRPVAAYATICGPGNTASSGWTVFCCTVNKGVNACPPGSFAAGWWKAADSSWCGNGYRYIVDCNASCSKCTTGCSDGMCDSRCWSCSCGTGSSRTCDQRRVCCNAFRYGQCNTQVRCSGGVHCRVVSCVAPYSWASCTTTSLQDNRTSEHSAPCLPSWSALEQKYKAMGAQGSFLRASTSPRTSVGDGRGQYVVYQDGSIYWTSKTGARSVPNGVKTVWAGVGGPRGILGYPTSDQLTGRPSGGWIQTFEKGAITASSSTPIKTVYGDAWTQWSGTGRESRRAGVPDLQPLLRDGWRRLAAGVPAGRRHRLRVHAGQDDLQRGLDRVEGGRARGRHARLPARQPRLRPGARRVDAGLPAR